MMGVVLQAAPCTSCSYPTAPVSKACAGLRPRRPVGVRGYDADASSWRPSPPAATQRSLASWQPRPGLRRLRGAAALLGAPCGLTPFGHGALPLPQQPRQQTPAAASSSSSSTAGGLAEGRTGRTHGRRATVVSALGSPAANTGLSDGGANPGGGPGQPGTPSPSASPASSSSPQQGQEQGQPGDHHQPGRNGQPADASAAASTSGSSSSTAAAAAGNAAAAASPDEDEDAATAAMYAAQEARLVAGAMGATRLDGMPETQKYVLADEWGFSRVGADMPEGAHPTIFARFLPEELFAFDVRAAAAALVVPLAAMAAGYGWLWYMHSIAPVWQQAVCAMLIGTGYAGLFKVAHECASYRFMPQAPGFQEALGTLLMLPSLYAFPSWRLGHLHHLLHVNMLWEDNWAWHPLTKVELATDIMAGRTWSLAVARLVLTTPLKFFASIGHWVRSFDGFDLRNFHPGSYWAILAGWAGPLLFAGLAFPAMLAAGGVSGFVSCYLAPWLVFHFWLSTLSLMAHTAPHVPWRADEEGHDVGQATIAGTVTVRLPRVLEMLLNNANYGLPQALAPALPLWHARSAYEALRGKLAPYLTEAPLSLKLLTNHVTKWQVYDEEVHTYRPMDEVVAEVEADLAGLAAMVAAEVAEAEAAERGAAEEPGGNGGGEGEGNNGTGRPALA